MSKKCIMLINVKMSTIVDILTFISRINTESESFMSFQSSRAWKKFFQSPLILIALLQVDLINVAYLTACAFIMTLHFLNDINDIEPTRISKKTS